MNPFDRKYYSASEIWHFLGDPPGSFLLRENDAERWLSEVVHPDCTYVQELEKVYWMFPGLPQVENPYAKIANLVLKSHLEDRFQIFRTGKIYEKATRSDPGRLEVAFLVAKRDDGKYRVGCKEAHVLGHEELRLATHTFGFKNCEEDEKQAMTAAGDWANSMPLVAKKIAWRTLTDEWEPTDFER